MYKHEMKTAVSHERAYKAHKERLRSMRGIVDCGPPFHNPHVYLKLKKMEYDERKNIEIDNANKNLLKRLQKVLSSDDSINRRKGGVKGPTTMNSYVREKRLEQIRRDNLGIAYRIENKKPFYVAKKWEEEYKQMKYLQGLWSNNNNEQYAIYNPTPRTHRGSMMSLNMSTSTRESRDFKSKHKDIEEDQYDDDFEDDDDSKTKEKKKDKEKTKAKENKGTLPPIVKQKKSEKNENEREPRQSKTDEDTKSTKAEDAREAEIKPTSAFRSPYTDYAQQ